LKKSSKVIPAKAGIQTVKSKPWIPVKSFNLFPAFAHGHQLSC
jgi:hypothetical protein